MFVCDDETKRNLQEWAKEERRSMSNLVEKLVMDAIAARKTQETEKANEQPKQTSQLS